MWKFSALITLVVAVLAVSSSVVSAFAPKPTSVTSRTKTPTFQLNAVEDIGSEGAFDKTIKNAGGKLVIVDYSTTWCGPCKGKNEQRRPCLVNLSLTQ